MVTITERETETVCCKDSAGLLRIWWADITNEEEMCEAISFARGLLEEIILAHRTDAKLEIWVKKRIPS